MKNQPQTERADYDYKKKKALDKVAATLEECLEHCHGEENDRLRVDLANYVFGYLGVSWGLKSGK